MPDTETVCWRRPPKQKSVPRRAALAKGTSAPTAKESTRDNLSNGSRRTGIRTHHLSRRPPTTGPHLPFTPQVRYPLSAQPYAPADNRSHLFTSPELQAQAKMYYISSTAIFRYLFSSTFSVNLLFWSAVIPLPLSLRPEARGGRWPQVRRGEYKETTSRSFAASSGNQSGDSKRRTPERSRSLIAGEDAKGGGGLAKADIGQTHVHQSL